MPGAAAPFPRTLDEYRRRGEEQLEAGAPLVAYDTLADGLKQFPADVRLRQLLALALVRTGAGRLAVQLLLALQQEGHADEETLGLLARTHKDLWAEAVDPRERHEHLQLAFAGYRDAHLVSGGYWSGINAATMALLLGERPQAVALAREVRERCLRAQAGASDAERYWILATLGEAALILGEQSEAEDRYAQAAASGRRRLGDVASTRRNARLIIRQLGMDGTRIEECLRVPRVVVFVGHLIDDPGRASPRFPPEIEPAVRTAIRDRLATLDAGFGYASAGCGGDILFLESLLELDGEAHIVLPYTGDQFVKDSVDFVAGADWRARYERLLERASEVLTVSDRRMAGGGLSYEYAFLMLDGLAGVRADELDTGLVPLALWDGKPGDGPGGTANSIAHWRDAGRPVEVIDLAEILRRERPDLAARADAIGPAVHLAEAQAKHTPSPFEPQLVGLLFGDARGFSGLNEDQIPQFVEHFLGAVGREVATSPHRPILTNTWGDGLYFVFSNVGDAGRFALGLCDAITRVDWTMHQLPKDLSLRIGLHAGPVYGVTDPVTGRPNFLGAHVSRAARIEPITPPGQVYASQAFAALAKAEGVQEFKCEYVGQTPLAKGYGTFPMYVVRRRARSSTSA